MASLKAKIRLSTALAFSATLGVTATTLLNPAVAVAESVTAEDFKYPELVLGSDGKPLVQGIYRLVPTFKGGDEGSTTWALSDDNRDYAKPLIRLDEETGVIEIPNMLAETAGEKIKVIATRDGKSYEVTVGLGYVDAPQNKNEYRYFDLPPYISYSSTTTKGFYYLPREDEDYKATPAPGSYKFNKDSMFWDDSYESIFTLDEHTGALSYKTGALTAPLSIVGTGSPAVIVPLTADIDGLEGTRSIGAAFYRYDLYRDTLPLGIDPVSVNVGESTTGNLYINASPDAFDSDKVDNPAPREKFSWEGGKNTLKAPEEVLEGKTDVPDRYGLELTKPEDLPSWIEYDSDNKTVTAKPGDDIEPGEYVFNFKYSYSADQEHIKQYLDKDRDGVAEQTYGDEAVLPLKVTVKDPKGSGDTDDSDKGTESSSGYSLTYHTSKIKVGSTGTIEADFKGDYDGIPLFSFDTESPDWDSRIEKWGVVNPANGDFYYVDIPNPPEGKDAWVIPIKVKLGDEVVKSSIRVETEPADEDSLWSSLFDLDGDDNQGATSEVRQVLANTGANVTTLIALGLLASVAGAAFLLYRRRSTN